MGKLEMNLATSPFPRYRLAYMALFACGLGLAALSVYQIVGYRSYSDLAVQGRAAERDAQAEFQAVSQRLSVLQARSNPEQTARRIDDIRFLNQLIDRRDFSWSRMLADLESLIPDAVHLISLRPEFGENSVVLRMTVRGRTIYDVSRFIESMEKSPRFEKLAVSVESRGPSGPKPEVDVEVAVGYKVGVAE